MLKQQLLQSRSKKSIEQIAHIAALDTLVFKKLIELMENKDEIDVSIKAAWVMSTAFEKNETLILPFQKRLIQIVKDTNEDAIKRNIVRVWSLALISDKYHWDIADICLNFLVNPKEAVAIKAFSITVLQNLISFLPELKEEIIFEVEKQLPHSSPAFKSRANAFLNKVFI